MDWLLWVIRAVLIVVGITMAIIVSKRKREGIYQGLVWLLGKYGRRTVSISIYPQTLILEIASTDE